MAVLPSPEHVTDKSNLSTVQQQSGDKNCVNLTQGQNIDDRFISPLDYTTQVVDNDSSSDVTSDDDRHNLVEECGNVHNLISSIIANTNAKVDSQNFERVKLKRKKSKKCLKKPHFSKNLEKKGGNRIDILKSQIHYDSR